MTPPSAHDDAATVPELSALLRHHGLRRTPSRLCTLRLLCASGEHLSSAEVCAELRQLGLPFDQATVYRTLETLTEVGLAHAVHGPGLKRYGVSSEPHHHTVCEECGRVRDLAIDHVREAMERITELTGLRAGTSGSLLLYGRCARCSE
ncbi:Fur family transcriptional regulator [Streptomyces sp. NRRL S-31]|uniref:Fur family transcriptional regulator n=1 Tax=Streptomyces sp. NRRL S-31 TaxID=1463898 RepID=UPI0005630C09|nr:Fur family transcriptional regulator [Streptomyces sp. NRRL S-31]